MLNKIVEELLYYGECHLGLDKEDEMFVRNILLHELNQDQPYSGDIDKKRIEEMETPTELISSIRSLLPDMDVRDIEKIMSIISPRPSDVIRKFNLLKKESVEKACEYFFKEGIYSNYIKADQIKKNIKWEYKGENNTLEITINMTKPEKSNKDIAKLKDMVITSYPKCSLCYSNEGYYGGGNIQPRSNIRVVPMKLAGEDYFMQYSPYAYYHEHAIIVNMNHIPMHIDNKTVETELAYLDEFPNYFIGSNSDLPIVGGSLLHHMHFQAGSHLMPMMFSKPRYHLTNSISDKVRAEYLDWYNSCIVVRSRDKQELLKVTGHILETFSQYSDEEIDLIASDELGRHNAETIIARKVEGEYIVFIIFRNNRCSDEYPDGIFHAHPEYHNIKKEGIGLIEAMGLFILPGRLKEELDLISKTISDSELSLPDFIKDHECLLKHESFINGLVDKYGRDNAPEKSKEIINMEVGRVCENVLKNTGLFKNTEIGQKGLSRFLKALEMEIINE